MEKPKTIDECYASRAEEIGEKNKQAYKHYVKETLESGQVPVRISIYDSSGNFKGYKVDSFWTLHQVLPKVHPLEDIRPSGHLLKNFLQLLNDESKKPKKEDLEVVVEELDSEGEPVKIAMKYHIYHSRGKYRAKLKN